MESPARKKAAGFLGASCRGNGKEEARVERAMRGARWRSMVYGKVNFSCQLPGYRLFIIFKHAMAIFYVQLSSRHSLSDQRPQSLGFSLLTFKI